ncbi:hypothetical protein CCACVL1_10669 [Corchorus capsularis]|uniref:Uncharacterized protein n=1 Tax=Corchorus capsularis TaxID=210143 RepID=A0A1R3IQC0_COCAP|nr:hypothetical protein CCACVL1_10669 [Corchorus capsularis]
MDRGQKKTTTSSRVLGYQSSRGFQPQSNPRLQPLSNPRLQRQASIGSQSQQSVELQDEPSVSSQSQRGRYGRSYVQWNREINMAYESGLLWDNEKKIVLFTSDTLHIWENYLKVCYFVCYLCNTGQHAENFEDAIDSMAAEAEDEMNSPPTQIPAQQDSTESSS